MLAAERRGDREFRCRFCPTYANTDLGPGAGSTAPKPHHINHSRAAHEARSAKQMGMFCARPELAEETVHEEGPSAIQGLHVSATHPEKETISARC